MAAVSAFVGAPLAVRARSTVAKRQQFSVQANTSGPKKVRAARQRTTVACGATVFALRKTLG
jgi:hypothetical protein